MGRMVCRVCANDAEKFINIGNGKVVCTSCASIVSNLLKENESFLADEQGMYSMNRPLGKKEQNNSSNIQTISYEKLAPFKPSSVKRKLDEYIVGQEQAKKIISVAAYNHMKRIVLNDKGLQKSNILLMGPTGSGKTLIARTLGKILDVPVAIVPATNLTEAGYIGDDVSTVIERLLQAAGGNVDKAQKGIVFIDEIDKLVSAKSGVRKEVGGKGVQQALLPILEGTVVNVNVPSGVNGMGVTSKVEIDTSHILFICGGAFPDLEGLIKKRLNGNTQIGFTGSSQEKKKVVDNVMQHTSTEDLIEFGLIPEFLGRLPVVTSLDKLNVEDLKRILTEPKDSIITQYQKLFAVDDILLIFEDDALEVIAERAVEKGTGARSLRSMLEELLLDLMYTMPDANEVHELVITVDFLCGKGNVLCRSCNVLDRGSLVIY